MNQNFLFGESIRQVQLFYYSSHNHIFINTVMIELFNQRNLPQNIKIIKTQINQPTHYIHGETPFLTVNKKNIVKKTKIWDFLLLLFNIDIQKKFQFLSIINSAQKLAKIVNIFSEYDQNPYFTFISPWKKYKRHIQLQKQKIWFKQNTQFFNSHDHSLNKQTFIYKINEIAKLIQIYSRQGKTKPQYLFIYKIIIYALMKHLRRIQQTLYNVAINAQNKILEKIQQQIQNKISINLNNNQRNERKPLRNILYTNVNLQFIKENQNQENRNQNLNQYNTEKEKFYQNIFKPFFATAIFALAMWAFNNKTKINQN